MTRLTTPTDTLVRIPFSGLTDFQPLALAPGLPMLDVNRLTYQILLGWFGDLQRRWMALHPERQPRPFLTIRKPLKISKQSHNH